MIALQKCCQSGTQYKDKAWYISDTTFKLIKAKRKARKLTQKYDDTEFVDNYKSLTGQVKRAVKADKEKVWNEEIGRLDGTREFWNSLFRITGAKARTERKHPLLKEDGTLTENDNEKADTFAASLGKIHNIHEGPIFDDAFKETVETTIKEQEELFSPLKDHTTEVDDDHEILTQIESGEIKALLNKCKSRSAPGMDGIRYGVLKQASEPVYDALAKIYNASLALGYFPETWKKAEGIMIPKPGKDGKIPINYRAISLLSCMGKLYEKILAKRIRDKWQNGYRCNKVAMEHVLRLVEETQLGFSKNGRVAQYLLMSKKHLTQYGMTV